MTTLTRHRLLSVLLATALVATLTTLLTQDMRADALDGPVDVVYVATGRNFPDALAGGTLAAATDAPLLTVEANLPLPAATVTALEALDPARIVVFGGEVAVSAEVFGALTTYARTGTVTRIAGNDRHETAGLIADALPNPGPVDADTLDGLDSDDFLSSDAADDFLAADGTATDSARLDGRDAADLRVLNIGNWTYTNGPVDLDGFTTGPRLDPDANNGVGSSFLVPPGHATGDPLFVDVVLIDEDFSACSVRISTQGTVARPGDDVNSFINFLAPGETGPAMTLDLPSGQSTHAITFEAEQFEGEPLEAGTALHFVFRRNGDSGADNCVNELSIAGAQLRY